MRQRTGNAFENDGRIYIAVSAKSRRYTKASPASASLDEGRDRARLAAQLVDRLLDAGRDTAALIDAVVQQAATLPTEKLDELAKGIALIVDGRLGGPASKATSARATTYGDVATLWTSGDLRRRFPDLVDETTEEYAANVAAKLRMHILPAVGDVAIAEFKIADAQRVMERIPPALSKSTRKQIALFLRRVLAFAVYPLQLIAANPIPDEFMPKAGRGRERNMLFVDEDRTMLACTESPIELRLLFGFQSREGMRREEACALEWRSVDLDRGWVYLDKNKTDAPRDWPLDSSTVEALVRWRALNPTARYVFGGDKPVSANKLAKRLRKLLIDAGVDRPQLHDSTKERMRAGTHDLRATFVTLAIAQGKGEGWIRRRTGHKSSSMVERYRRNADNLGEGSTVMLVPLFLAIPELHAHAGPIACDVGVSSPSNAYGGGAGSSIAAVTNDERAEFPRPVRTVGAIGFEPTTPTVSIRCPVEGDQYFGAFDGESEGDAALDAAGVGVSKAFDSAAAEPPALGRIEAAIERAADSDRMFGRSVVKAKRAAFGGNEAETTEALLDLMLRTRGAS